MYGSEYCLLDILDGLKNDPFRWTVILPKGNGFDQLLLDRGIDCQFLMPSVPEATSRAQRFFCYLSILRRLRQLQPHVLYVNQTGSLKAAAFYARLLKLPIVCQVQTLEDARWLSSRPKLHSRVCAFICNSQFIADQTRIDEGKKCVLYQGLPALRTTECDFHNLSPRTKDPAQPCTVGILGRIAVSKGHYLLLEAAQKLSVADANFRFVVIGEGLTAKDTQEFREAVAQAGLASRFEFRGYRTDLLSELRRIDILTIPSLAEPLGRVLFDAAQFGVPTVLSDAGGLGELARRFSIGTCFRSEDSNSLARAIMTVWSHYDESASVFSRAAVQLFHRLPMTSYIAGITEILRRSANHQSSCIQWFGEDK